MAMCDSIMYAVKMWRRLVVAVAAALAMLLLLLTLLPVAMRIGVYAGGALTFADIHMTQGDA